MKKFLLSLALLSMTSLLFTACGNKEEAATEETPAAEETVVEPVVTEPATDAAATDEKAAEDSGVKVEATGDVKVEAETKTE